MDDRVVSTVVACRFCGELVPARRLPEHEERCRQREHPTQERFE